MSVDATRSLGDIAHLIQLAIAPVFLLSAVGTLLTVLTNRLGRAVDRRRVLGTRLTGLDATTTAIANAELGYIDRRVRLIYTAITLAVLCALLICMSIAAAFVDAFIRFDLGKVVAAFFVLAMLALIASLGAFLREIFLAVTTAHCPIV